MVIMKKANKIRLSETNLSIENLMTIHNPMLITNAAMKDLINIDLFILSPQLY